MEKENLKYEALQLAIFSDIVSMLSREIEEISLIKLIVFSFIVKRNAYSGTVYNLKTKKNILEKLLSTMLGEMERFNENLVYIVRAIDLLVKNNVLKVSGNSVYYLNSDKDFSSHRYKIDSFTHKAIDESKYLSDEQFISEVIANV